MRILLAEAVFGVLALALLGVISEAGPVRDRDAGTNAEVSGHHNAENNGQIKSRVARSRSRLTDGDCYYYLQRYGYMHGNDDWNRRWAVMKFQRFSGLYQSGYLDDQTREMMDKPRCGNQDPDQGTSRKKRYVVSRYGKWRRNDLRYTLKSYNARLGQAKTEEIIRKAFDHWSSVTPLRFTQVPYGSQADIEIIFGRRRHYTASYDESFDGPGNALAHAYFPNIGDTLSGDAHFDEDEDFTDGTYDGINLLQVAVHEFGHSLGLEHSNNNNAVMAPFYRGYEPNLQLKNDDIAGIQSIYGRNTNEPPTQPPVNPPTQPPFNPPTQPPFNPPTQPPFNPPTQPPFNPPTQPPFNPPTQPPFNPPTQPPFNPQTQPPFNPQTQPPVFPTIWPPVFPTNRPPVFPTNGPPVFPTNGPPVFPTNRPPVFPTNGPPVFPTNRPPFVPTRPPFIPSQATRNPFATRPPSFSTPASPTFSGGDICTDGRADAMVAITDLYGQSHILAFRGSYYMLLDDYGISNGPSPLQGIPGLSIDKVDAAISYSSNQILLFRGSLIHTVTVSRFYWGITLDVRTPSSRISSRYYDLPNDLDAFFEWGSNGYIATKGNQFFRFNSASGYSYSVQRGDMRRWGLANGIDGGVRYSNGRTYVFKGTQYYRLREDNIRRNRRKTDSGYPRSIAAPWYGC